MEFGILGAGGQADEAESYLDSESKVLFRAIDKEYIHEPREGITDILSPEDYQKVVAVVAAIGAPAVRREMVSKWPGERYESIQSQDAYVDKTVKLGEGCIIAPRAVITTNVEIGAHSIINVAATVSHNSRIGEYVTVGPGAHVAGNVELGDGVFVGIGAIISNSIKIASGCVIGAGAVVMDNILIENSVAVGVPARVIKQNDSWLREV